MVHLNRQSCCALTARLQSNFTPLHPCAETIWLGSNNDIVVNNVMEPMVLSHAANRATIVIVPDACIAE